MANIAFTGLFLLLLAVPGFIFRFSYYSNQFTRDVLPRNWTDDIAKAFLVAIPLHIICIWGIEILQHKELIHTSLGFKDLGRLLTGHYGTEFDELVDTLYANTKYILAYGGLVCLFAWGAGHLLRKVVWSYELDVKLPKVFGYRSLWLYKLLGRGELRIKGKKIPHDEIVVWVDALTGEATEVKDKKLIYRGIAAAFTTDQEGNLREILLTKARRGKPEALPDIQPRIRWETIPGDYFILKYKNILNINITYLHKQQSEAQEPS